MVITLVGSLLWKFNVWHTDLDSLPPAHGSLISDNRGNIFALLNQKTEQMPTSAFLMQLIVMLHRAGFRLAPSHMKREYNQWADELTHPHFTGFRPDRQLPVSEAFSNFKFLWSLLDNQPLGPNCKRHKTDQKANLRSNGAWRSRLFSILQWWYEHWVLVAPIARASGFGGRVDMQCDTTTSFDGFLEGNRLMIHVASKQKPSRTGQLHSKRPSAAAAACLRTNSIREHYVIYIYIFFVPVVPHKAVAEVSKVGNL